MPLAAASADIALGRRQLYMLPTRYGLLFALLLAVLLLASINYGNGLGYALTFLLASTVVVSMLSTHRNLHQLTIASGACAPVFAGETAVFRIALTNASARPRLGVRVVCAGTEVARLDLPPHSVQWVEIAATAPRRGYLAAPPFVISTEFPLGLLYSWSRALRLPQRCLVYPAPAQPPGPLALALEPGVGEARQPGGGDDFIGQREYRPGDPPRHVNWRAVARGQQWHTKEFGSAPQASVVLDWDALPGLDPEERLRALCRGVLDSAAGGRRYGLRLPGTDVPPGGGEAHEHRCLAALALFGM